MTLADTFAAFHRGVNNGHDPYPWQITLVEYVASHGRWPDRIVAPTGAGKSVVIDAHAFLNAAFLLFPGMVARPPRRLILVAPRRVLVDDQHQRALALAAFLTEPSSVADGASDAIVVRSVHDALQDLRTVEERPGDEGATGPLGVAALRGGVLLDLRWRLEPSRCQVICATPQMWGSRALFRGYRASNLSRNLEAGLVAQDVAVVLDEAHLHPRLLETARSISRINIGPLGLQTVEMTATPRVLAPSEARPPLSRGQGNDREGLVTVELDESDYATSGSAAALTRRVKAGKSISLVAVGVWDRSRTSVIVEAAGELRAELGKGTVGVYVNTVNSLLNVVDELTTRDPEATVAAVCGRLRPADLDRLRREYPHLLDAQGDGTVDYLVATQSLEVGVDLDLPAIVTELAPAPALAQRLGRLNRSGGLESAPFVVVAPPREELVGAAEGAKQSAAYAPYDPATLSAACDWIEQLAGDGSPFAVSRASQPVASPLVTPPLTQAVLEVLSQSSEPLAAEPDIGLYIDEPSGADVGQVTVAVRDWIRVDTDVVGTSGRLGSDPPVACIARALLEIPPRRHEVSAVSVPLAKSAHVVERFGGSWVLRSKDGKMVANPVASAGDDDVGPWVPRAGDVLVLPAGSKVLRRGVLDLRPAAGLEPIGDVMEQRPPAEGSADVVLRLDPVVLEAALEIDPYLASSPSRRALADALSGLANPVGTTLARRIRTSRTADLELRWWCDPLDERGALDGLLTARAAAGEGRPPRTAVTDKQVTIDDHGRDVQDRLERIVAALDVPALGVSGEVLSLAARVHDEGKRHPRFQENMGAESGGPALAKPRPGHAPDGGVGMRHEQVSAGYAVVAEGGAATAATIQLGHHGHGQALFRQRADALLEGWDECPPDVRDAIVRLFGPGGTYEREREALQRQVGVHGLAYLQALLRAADMQVSREGR